MLDRFVCSEDDIYIALDQQCAGVVTMSILTCFMQSHRQQDLEIISSNRVNRYCLDLPLANKYQALRVGIPEKNIWLSGECTFCNPDKYYS